MIQLVIDRGNSACKWAFFSLDEQQPDMTAEPLEVLTTLSGEMLPDNYFEQYQPQAGIYSSVGPADEAFIAALRERIPQFYVYALSMKMPIRNAYRTPQTLGLDRLAAAVGAWTLAPGKSSLIVDMGTAITYDFMTSDGVYQGGNIAPGIWLRFKVLHQETAALPLVEAREDFPEMGVDTQTAIRAGVMQGILHELQGYLNQYRQIDENLTCFMTGGDISYFESRVKFPIFARKNLVLIGLNRILYDHVHRSV